MTGQISLEHPFENSWIWETDSDTVWVSMIIVNPKERRKGHTRRLLKKLIDKYKRVIVPNPSGIMLKLITELDFKLDTDFDPEVYDLWIKEREQE